MPAFVAAAAFAMSAACAGVIRRAITAALHDGHGPRQVTRPLGAVVSTRVEHFGQTPDTANVPRLFAVMVPKSYHRKSYGVGMTRQEDLLERLRRLAEGVRRSERAHRDSLTCRNNEIIEANTVVGLSLGAIAKATGLHRKYIQEIVTVHERRTPGPGTGDHPGKDH